MPDETLKAIKTHKVALKGPVTTPVGKGFKSVNVQLRQKLKLYAAVRPVRSLKGVKTRYEDVDMVIVRENTEGLYSGIENEVVPGVVTSLKVASEVACTRIARYAFRYATKRHRKKITVFHKANIMKITDGLFLDCFYEVAKEYPQLKADDVIVDDLCMKLVTRPDTFDVVVLTNLQGDIVSDLCAGLVGGLGFAPSANIGDHICIFEAVHGTAPDIAGKNIANPTALLLSGIAMLRHLGMMQHAAIIENALLYTLENGIHTGDFGDKSIPAVNTTQFADAIISNFGKQPEVGAKPVLPNMPATPTYFKLEKNSMMVSAEMSEEKIVGVDMFIESAEQPLEISKKCERHAGVKFKLLSISNRGTQVWPTGSVYTNLVNQYNARFESLDGEPLFQQDVIGLYVSLSGNFKICSLELLNSWGDKKAYSLAQGQ
jgi:isocitrate dehydrogenase